MYKTNRLKSGLQNQGLCKQGHIPKLAINALIYEHLPAAYYQLYILTKILFQKPSKCWNGLWCHAAIRQWKRTTVIAYRWTILGLRPRKEDWNPWEGIPGTVWTTWGPTRRIGSPQPPSRVIVIPSLSRSEMSATSPQNR